MGDENGSHRCFSIKDEQVRDIYVQFSQYGSDDGIKVSAVLRACSLFLQDKPEISALYTQRN